MTLALCGLMIVGLIIGLSIRVPDTRHRELESIEADLATHN
jgi:hypothetical protein